MVRVWNVLPSELVELESVKSFQKSLTVLAKRACQDEALNWSRMYSVDSLPFSLIVRYGFA